MKTNWLISAVFAFAFGVGPTFSWADDFPKNVDFETLITFPLVVEGLTGNNDGNLYTSERS